MGFEMEGDPLQSRTFQEASRSQAMSETKDTKPEHLNLKVKSQDGNEVFFKVKKTTSFKRLMEAYCAKVGADKNSVRFLFDGERIDADSTPADLGMENEDEIDAMVQQTGGFYF
uniref:Ubiquitin-like domain-containing protein n=1 Tax=Lotharella oceanica TaxID=641309 RepID=A0A7S2TZU2_9EUKA